MGIKLGIIGCGRFSEEFIGPFKAHPLVEKVVLCDLYPQRLQEYAQKFGIADCETDLDALLRSDIDSVAIFVQRHMHGAITLKCLNAGKNVFGCVPVASSLDEIGQIVQTVEKTGLCYMTAETSYYSPAAIYCRERYKRGHFGRFVYGESGYLHDMSEGFYEAFQHTGGENWKAVAGIPPMYYPTHSMSHILSIVDAHATHVSCLGFEEQHEDGIFRRGANLWDNPFVNQSALLRVSNGGMMRANEFRRVVVSKESNFIYMTMMNGTDATYEQSSTGSTWMYRAEQGARTVPLTDRLKANWKKDYDPNHVERFTGKDNPYQTYEEGISCVHNVKRLPESFRRFSNCHMGSHHYLIDDFCRAVHEGAIPPCHVWNAAHWCAPGLVAHESALREGEMLPVPYYGAPPANARLLKPDEAFFDAYQWEY